MQSLDKNSGRYRNCHRWFAALIVLWVICQDGVWRAQQSTFKDGGRVRETVRKYDKRRRQGRSLLDIDLNVADKNELTLLPNIGPVLAERIVDYRSQHGEFHDLRDLVAVPGIGLKTVQAIQGIAVTKTDVESP